MVREEQLKMRKFAAGATNRPRLVLIAAMAVLPLLALGNGACAQQLASSWGDVSAAADKEGKVTIYTGTSRPILDKAIEAFNKQHPGVKFDVLDGEGPDLNARIDQEIAGGTPIADIYLSTDSQWLSDGNGKGNFMKLIGPAAKDFPEKFRNGDTYKVAILAAGIVVNTDLVSKPVVGYEDLLRDEFGAGRLGVQQWSNNIAPGFYKHVEALYPGLLDKLATQKPTIYRNSEAGAASVASGERAATLWSVPAVPVSLIAQGAPVKFVIPEKPYGLATSMSILAKAPHPNAAQLFVDFVLSKDGQTLWNSKGSGQASPLGFGDFDPATVDIWDPSAWPADQTKQAQTLWTNRFQQP
jgi:iron(III) transport system substrate-binding protein